MLDRIRRRGTRLLNEHLDLSVEGGPGAAQFGVWRARIELGHREARALSARRGGIRVHSVYVPNGRIPDSDHYRYKLTWLAALRDQLSAEAAEAMVCGDMNIAPTDEDVFDPAAYVGHTHVTAPERAALAALEAVGLHDVVRERWPGERVFTYCDYRARIGRRGGQVRGRARVPIGGGGTGSAWRSATVWSSRSRSVAEGGT